MDVQHLPKGVLDAGGRTYRALTIEGENIEFSDGFADLHTESYKQILDGNGFDTKSIKESIALVQQIRNSGS